MTASSWSTRTSREQDAPAREASRTDRSWIGVDVAKTRSRPLPAAMIPLVVIALGVALAIVALRIDLIRARYAVSAVLAEEEALLEEQRELIVRQRQLRDPVALAVKARERGFVPPAQMLSMPEPAPMGEGRQAVPPGLPGVAAPPPNAPEGAEWQ